MTERDILVRKPSTDRFGELAEADGKHPVLVICDSELSRELIDERKRLGLDGHDEVWDGVYVMSPLADDEHQEIVGNLIGMLSDFVVKPGLGKMRPGVNISDRPKDWRKNYRVPDAVVFLPGNTALNKGSHWLGGPDWAAEIVSPGDRSRDKLDFYAKVGTRELLLIDRDPWALELYQLKRRKLRLVGTSTPEAGETLASVVLPLSFRRIVGKTRPSVEVAERGGDRKWLV